MSNYTLKVKCKKTGEVHTVAAMDDYFGHHKYGYVFNSGKHCNLVLDEKQLEINYEMVD